MPGKTTSARVGAFMKLSRKFDLPLFTAAWALGKSADDAGRVGRSGSGGDSGAAGKGLVIFAGGGGEGRHGIKSKIIVARYDDTEEELSEEVLSVTTGVTPAFKLAVHPNGDAIIAAFAKGCKVFQVVTDVAADVGGGARGAEGGVKLEELEGVRRKLEGVLGSDVEQKCVVFSPDGTCLAAGDEEGRVVVMEWPSLNVVLDIAKGHSSSIKDADFSFDSRFLATTADSGPLRVWDLERGAAAATLAIAVGGRLGYCRFSRSERRPFLFTTAVKGGKGYVVVWDTMTWKQLGVKKVQDEPICSFAISPDANFLATGTSDGDLGVVDVKSMAVRQRVKGAHMVFVTAMEFSPSSKEILSVSGDSSVRVTPVTAKPSGARPWHGVALFIALFLLSAIAAVIFAHSEFAQRFFQFPYGAQQPAFPYWQKFPDRPPATPPSPPPAASFPDLDTNADVHEDEFVGSKDVDGWRVAEEETGEPVLHDMSGSDWPPAGLSPSLEGTPEEGQGESDGAQAESKEGEAEPQAARTEVKEEL